MTSIKGLSTINARAESITKAPTWREAMKKRRCIVPVDALSSGTNLASRRSSLMPLNSPMET